MLGVEEILIMVACLWFSWASLFRCAFWSVSECSARWFVAVSRIHSMLGMFSGGVVPPIEQLKVCERTSWIATRGYQQAIDPTCIFLLVNTWSSLNGCSLRT
jgi:hypothetical protein